jgi:hypothetical protein
MMCVLLLPLIVGVSTNMMQRSLQVFHIKGCGLRPGLCVCVHSLEVCMWMRVCVRAHIHMNIVEIINIFGITNIAMLGFYVCVCVCVCMCGSACACVCVCILTTIRTIRLCVCRHTHTHTHTNHPLILIVIIVVVIVCVCPCVGV